MKKHHSNIYTCININKNTILKILTKKSIIIINTHALTPNKNPVFNHKKSIIVVNTHALALNKNFFIRINAYK